MFSCSIWYSAPTFWMGGDLESRCVGRVCGADVADVHVCMRLGSVSIRTRLPNAIDLQQLRLTQAG